MHENLNQPKILRVYSFFFTHKVLIKCLNEKDYFDRINYVNLTFIMFNRIKLFLKISKISVHHILKHKKIS